MPRNGNVGEPPVEVRLDVWLDVACLFKTRSDAQSACKNGKLSVNGQVAKPDRRLRPGDNIEIGRPFGRKQRVVVRGFADRMPSPGFLFPGISESLLRATTAFQLEEVGRAFVYVKR